MRKVGSTSSTAKFFITINKIGYISGLPNMWIDEVEVSNKVKAFCRIYRLAMIAVITTFISLEWLSFYSQRSLTEKQRGDLLMFSFSHPVYFLWIIVAEYKRDRISDLLYQLAVVLKENYNDEEVEKNMLRKAKENSAAISISFLTALLLYGYNGIVQVVRGEGTFTTVITFWPEVHDPSLLAGIARTVSFVIWWGFLFRVCTVYIIIISTVICLSHQFKHLQSYFRSLDKIFQREDLQQKIKETKYEEAFKIGVRMHWQTIMCTNKCQEAYGLLFSCQVFLGVAVLVSLMSQMVHSDRTLENVLSIVTTVVFMLISTGFVMWNAGDVTVEAAGMATAVYSSGWQNCQQTSWHVRQLMVFAVAQSQRPVMLWALGIVALSYSSYVSIVRTAYSVFSVLY